jgi:steroid delta-isomerase-like uncharacterized protein
MSTEENKALALRSHLEVFNQDKLDVADEIFGPDFVWHSPGLPPEASHGPEGVKYFARMLRSAFPDYELNEDDTIAEGDRVVNRWTMRGTHEGESLGIPPTGKQGTATGIDIFRIANGKLVEAWQNWDQLGFLQQLGVIPSAE